MSDPSGRYNQGRVVADRDREGMLLVRAGTEVYVKLDIQMLGVYCSPDGGNEYVLHGIAHYQWV